MGVNWSFVADAFLFGLSVVTFTLGFWCGWREGRRVRLRKRW